MKYKCDHLALDLRSLCLQRTVPADPEVKHGYSARFTTNQLENIPKLQNRTTNFIPVGKNAMKVNEFKPLINNHLPYTGNYGIVVRWFE